LDERRRSGWPRLSPSRCSRDCQIAASADLGRLRAIAMGHEATVPRRDAHVLAVVNGLPADNRPDDPCPTAPPVPRRPLVKVELHGAVDRPLVVQVVEDEVRIGADPDGSFSWEEPEPLGTASRAVLGDLVEGHSAIVKELTQDERNRKLVAAQAI